jgi:hypothetical protein
MEAHQGVRTYKDVKIWKGDNSAMDWINARLKADGFRPLP